MLDEAKHVQAHQTIRLHVEHEAELHQIEVHRRTGRLDDEHVVAADAAADFDAAFAVAELLTQGGGRN